MTNGYRAGALALLCLAAAPTGAAAQALTPEELRALIDQRVEGMNPYQELLNDPDPERSLAAVEIMMGSGDPQLVRMAREFGLSAANPQVKRAALEAYLGTQPVLSIRFAGKGLEETQFASLMRNWYSASVDKDLNADVSWRVGAFDPEKGCYTYGGSENCFVFVGFDGVLLKGGSYAAKGVLSEDGSIVGSANVERVTQPFPFSVQLLD